MKTSQDVNKEILNLLEKAIVFEEKEESKANDEWRNTDFRPISFGKRVTNATGMSTAERSVMRRSTYHSTRKDIFKNMKETLYKKISDLEKMVN